MFWFDMRGNDKPCNRKAISHSLCHSIDICIYSCKIMAEEFTGSSITTLNAVSNVACTELIAEGPDLFQETHLCNIDPPDTLYAFNNNRRNFLTIFLKTFFQCFFIIERKEDHIFCFINRSDIIFVIRNSDCQRGSSMK